MLRFRRQTLSPPLNGASKLLKVELKLDPGLSRLCWSLG